MAAEEVFARVLPIYSRMQHLETRWEKARSVVEVSLGLAASEALGGEKSIETLGRVARFPFSRALATFGVETPLWNP